MPLIRRRDQIRSAAYGWINEMHERAIGGGALTKPEEDIVEKLGGVPDPDNVTESILRAVGKNPELMACHTCKQPIHNGWEFVKDLVCLRCLSIATKELSRL